MVGLSQHRQELLFFAKLAVADPMFSQHSESCSKNFRSATNLLGRRIDPKHASCVLRIILTELCKSLRLAHDFLPQNIMTANDSSSSERSGISYEFFRSLQEVEHIIIESLWIH